MLQAMFSGVSGLQAHQTKLDVIGNNIANVNTIGFKAGRVTFQDQLSQTLRSGASPSSNAGGQNPSQVGLGVALGAVDTLQTQGNLQTTGKSTDLAIQGNGFFLVSNGSSTVYTRDGSFDLDSDGVLVNPADGVKLLGYLADSNGVIDTSQQVDNNSVLKVPVGSLTSVKETSQATFNGNLNAAAALPTTVSKLSGTLDPSQIPPVINSTVYDSLGKSHTVALTLSNPVTTGLLPVTVPPTTQSWDVAVSVDGNSVSLGTPAPKLYAKGGAFSMGTSPAVLNGQTIPLNVAGSSGAPDFYPAIDFSGLKDASTVTSAADGQPTPNPIVTKNMTLAGNLMVDSVPAATSIASLIYDSTGTASTLTVKLSNPSVPPAGTAPAGATASWDVTIDNGGPALYDSTAGAPPQSKIYYVPGSGFVTADSVGNSQGSVVLLNGAVPGSANVGQQPASGPITIDLSKLTTSKVTAVADGQTGPSPVWNTSLTTFDSLGVAHQFNFKFSRALVGSGAPGSAAARWEWAATENGTPVADSTQAGNSAFFFDNAGKLINTKNQTLTITPKGGSAPFTVSVDFSALTQLADKDSSVEAATQDGFAVGTLQSFAISPEGLVSGIFSNGQTRTLGQIATASFSNPAGLEKVGQNLFKDSSNSGLAQVGLPNSRGRGKISTGFVEMSNVDLSTEFTNLIVTQRGFQANTRIISTVDDLLQDVINLKR